MFELIDKPDSLFQEVGQNTFIFEWHNCLSKDFCNRMIEQFENSPEEQHKGIVSFGIERPELKQSTDLYLKGEPQWDWADKVLYESIDAACSEMGREFYLFSEDALEDTGYQIQRTLPGQFYHWHKDLNRFSRKRVLVFIWYLNDVSPGVGGTTDFKFQNISVQPEAGKLVVFPPYWTHLHRNALLKSGVKYICTGWISYSGADDYDGVNITIEGEDGNLSTH